jgi:hypothetical protein
LIVLNNKEGVLELIIAFVISFVASWFLLRGSYDIAVKCVCPKKDSMVELVGTNGHNKILMKEVRQYACLQIQNGRYEYEEVLDQLKKVRRDDKKRKANEINA